MTVSSADPVRTAAVVVDWRRPEETVQALRSLAAMTPPPDRVICVENGCTPDQVAAVRAAAPGGTEIIELETNLGFAGGVNAGMDVALAGGADWVLLLNNDATVAPLCLAHCLEAAGRDPRVAVAGPAVRFADRTDLLWYAGGEVSHRFAYTRHRGLMRPSALPPPSGDTAFVSGCCALVRSAAWRDLGPYRGDYFAYYEDVEWSVRARAAGWRCLYVGEVLCDHAVSVSSGQRGDLGLSETTAYYLARNPLRFALESRPVALRLSRVTGILSVWLGYNAWRILRSRRPGVGRAYLRGLLDASRGRMGPRPVLSPRRRR